jgi:hypothetical protein
VVTVSVVTVSAVRSRQPFQLEPFSREISPVATMRTNTMGHLTAVSWSKRAQGDEGQVDGVEHELGEHEGHHEAYAFTAAAASSFIPDEVGKV